MEEEPVHSESDRGGVGYMPEAVDVPGEYIPGAGYQEAAAHGVTEV